MVLPYRDEPVVSVDTNVVSLLTSGHADRFAYQELLNGRRLVLTMFVQGEIRAMEWRGRRLASLRALLGSVTFLDSPSLAAIDHFALLKRTSAQLGLVYGAEREDLWMLAQSRSDGFVVATDDRNAARVARACDMEVLTALRSIEEDYARDRQRLARLRSP